MNGQVLGRIDRQVGDGRVDERTARWMVDRRRDGWLDSGHMIGWMVSPRTDMRWEANDGRVGE